MKVRCDHADKCRSGDAGLCEHAKEHEEIILPFTMDALGRKSENPWKCTNPDHCPFEFCKVKCVEVKS